MAEGPPSELRTAGDHIRIAVDDRARAERVLARFDGALVVEDPEATPPGSPPGGSWIRVRLAPPATPAAVNAALVSEGVQVGAVVPERATLEEVFLSLVEGADVPR